MRPSISILVTTVLLVIIVKENTAQTSSTNKVFCYFESWTKWREGNGKYTLDNIDPKLCTHISVAFIGLTSDGSGSIIQMDSGPYGNFIDLKKQNPNVKLLVSMGGWEQGSAIYSNAVAFHASRKILVKNIYNFVTANKFDGFDFDWEYPGTRGGSIDVDKVNYITFLKELRAKFGNELLITAAVGATQSSIDSSYDVKNMNIYLDYINLMSYDLHGSWDGQTGQNAPLYASSVDTNKQLNQNACVKAWLQAGVSADKLFLGVGFYGRSYTLSNSGINKVGSPTSGGGKPGKYSAAAGMLTYLEICELQKAGGWSTIFDNEQKTPYSYNGDQWVGYDDVQSLEIKSQYAKDMKLAGIMVWSMNGDDHSNVCGNGKYPLLSAVNKALQLKNTGSTATQATAPASIKPPATPVTTDAPSSGAICIRSGYMRDPVDCNIFYQCVENSSHSGWIRYKQNCPANLYYDLNGNFCNYKKSVQGC